MASMRVFISLSAAVFLSGCSGIEFLNHDDGHSHPYRVAMPALKVVTDPDCKMTAEVISIPGRYNYLKFKSGLGKIDDSVEFDAGGTIKKVQAKQEGVADDVSKVLGAVTAAAKSAGAFGLTGEEASKACAPSVRIYPIDADSGTLPKIAPEPSLTIRPIH